MSDHIRRYVIGAALLAGVLATAGCSTGTGTAAAQAPVTVAPSADLAGALARLGRETARFTVAPAKGERVSGVIDPATGDWEMAGNDYAVRRIGPDLYVRLSAEPANSVYPGQYAADLGKWVHLKVPSAGLAFDRDFPWTPARGATSADLDVDGRVSRVTTADMVVSYSDYGTPVRVQAPPADQTIEDHLFTPANLGPIF
ncbi:hypothetical protein [Actinoplanes sp. HUAS TT8]|uniref:hypothetical protein n=1 Tax=Actinoplanes sp. HUAS TT8 TaxID=3447453 RepID=UPI003F521694